MTFHSVSTKVFQICAVVMPVAKHTIRNVFNVIVFVIMAHELVNCKAGHSFREVNLLAPEFYI